MPHIDRGRRTLHGLGGRALHLRHIEDRTLTPAARGLVGRLLATAPDSERLIFDAHHVAIERQLGQLKLGAIALQLERRLIEDLVLDFTQLRRRSSRFRLGG